MAQGAPKGNQFWLLRSKHGRDKLFATPELLWEAACEYFEWCEEHPWNKKEAVKGGDLAGTVMDVPTERPFTLTALCLYLDINTLYFRDFKKGISGKEDEMSKDFSRVITRIEETIYSQKFEGAAVGAFNHNIIARDLGLAERNEHTGKDGGPIPINNTGSITHNIKFSDASDGTDQPET